MRKHYVLITGVLVLGAAAVLMMEQREAKGNDPRIRASVFKAEQFFGVEKISIAQGEQRTVIVKAGEGEWQVDAQVEGQSTFPADAKQVASLVDSLERAKILELIATKKSSWTGMGLDVPKTVIFSGKNKDVLIANFGDVRKTGGQFVSFGAEEKAYVLSEAVTLNLESPSWELKTLINIKPENIKAVAFHPADTKSERSVRISREKVEDPFAVDGIAAVEGAAKPVSTSPAESSTSSMVSSVDSSLADVTFIRRWDIGNEESKTAMLSPAKFAVNLFDGRVINGIVGKIEGAQPKFFLHLEVAQGTATEKLDSVSEQLNSLMSSYTFEIPSWIAERLLRSNSDFVEGSTPETPASKKLKTKSEKKSKKASASDIGSGGPG